MTYKCPYCEEFEATAVELRAHINDKHPYNRYPQWLIAACQGKFFKANQDEEIPKDE